MTTHWRRLGLCGALLVLSAVGARFVGARILQPTGSDVGMSPHALRSHPIDVCRTATTADRLERVRVTNWGQPVMTHSPTAGGKLHFTPVTIEVLESLKGGAIGIRTVYAIGPFDPSTGEFLEGRLVKNAEAYLGSSTIEGVEMILGQSFWPLSNASGTTTVSLGAINVGDVTVREWVAGTKACPALLSSAALP